MSKYTIPSVTVDVSDFAITTDDGEIHPREGQHVRFKRKVSGRMVKLMLKVMRMRNLDMDDNESVEQFEESLDQIVPHLAKSIVDWNFTNTWEVDEDGVRLPLPPMPSVEDIWDLDYEEIFYLVNKLFSQLQAPKN